MSNQKQKEKRETAPPHKVWLAGLGAWARAQEQGTELFDELVERGREVVAQRKERVKDDLEKMGTWLDNAFSRIGSELDSKLKEMLEHMGVPKKGDVDDLARKIDELDARLNRNQTSQTSAGGPSFTIAPHRQGWQVLEDGVSEPCNVFKTKAEASRAGAELARRRAPSTLVTLKKDGSEQSRREVAAS